MYKQSGSHLAIIYWEELLRGKIHMERREVILKTSSHIWDVWFFSFGMFDISNSWKSTSYRDMSAKVLSPWMYTKILSCSPVNELSIVWPFRFAMARQEPDDLYMSCAATDLDCTHVLHVVWGFFWHHLTGKGSTGSVPCPRSQRAPMFEYV